MNLTKIPAKIAIGLIQVYQKTFSPDHGPLRSLYPYGYCRFYPTCSEYSKISIQRHGLVEGVALSFLRILRCNPFTQPKVDLP